MSTYSPARSADASVVDLLDRVSVSVPCGACGQFYEVTLRQVLLSQELLHAGCPRGGENECPPLTYAALADEAAIRDLERSWARVVRQVAAMGYELTIGRRVLTH